MKQEALILNADFQYALDALEKTDRNFFITGRAGTGKSTLLQLFRNTTQKKVVVLAPTGVAALNVKGQTIHSFFGLPPRLFNPKEIKKKKDRRLFKNMETLVIDEISMVRADILDAIDISLRVNRDNPAPFGGVQIVFFGDLFQLPPVVAGPEEKQFFQTYYSHPFYFGAKVFQGDPYIEMEMIELRQVFRQEQKHFLRLLEAIRLNRADEEVLEELNARYQPNFEPEDLYITLSARNASVDAINQRELAKLTGHSQYYSARVTGDFKPQLFPAEPRLELKTDAQVMLLKNDPERRFVNGTIGKVLKMHPESVEVEVPNPDGTLKKIDVEYTEWEVLRYVYNPASPNQIETEILGAFEQLPLRLAWAVTIHKAQGKTFDRVVIDMGRGAFEHGQTYVALSRCRTLEGIVLKEKLRPQDVMVDERIVEFYDSHPK